MHRDLSVEPAASPALRSRPGAGGGTTAGDQTGDSVVVAGTFGDDVITAAGAGPQVRVTGLAAIVTTRGSDPALDNLQVDTKAGNDSVSVTGSTNELIGFTFS